MGGDVCLVMAEESSYYSRPGDWRCFWNLLLLLLSSSLYQIKKSKSNCSQFQKYCTNAVTEISTGTSHSIRFVSGDFLCCLVKREKNNGIILIRPEIPTNSANIFLITKKPFSFHNNTSKREANRRQNSWIRMVVCTWFNEQPLLNSVFFFFSLFSRSGWFQFEYFFSIVWSQHTNFDNKRKKKNFGAKYKMIPRI